jgi:hypothetical protein
VILVIFSGTFLPHGGRKPLEPEVP